MLNEEQTTCVYEYLRSLGRLRRSTREELLDHLCCDIENTMVNGMSFDAAFAICQTRWNENEVKTIHLSTKKQLPMVKLMSLLAVVVSTMLLSGPMKKDTTTYDNDTSAAISLETLPESIVALQLEPPSVCPLNEGYRITSEFGTAMHPVLKVERFHRGIDFSASLGTPVYAGGDGVVVEASEHKGYGLRIIISHDEVYETLYAHLSSIEVKVGQNISAGDLIGKVGSTGVSTGPHLHYEILRNGESVNPRTYLERC